MEIWWKIWREFCGNFSRPQNKRLKKLGGHFGAFFVRKFVAQTKIFRAKFTLQTCHLNQSPREPHTYLLGHAKTLSITHVRNSSDHGQINKENCNIPENEFPHLKDAQTMKCKLWTETLEFSRLKVPNSRFALHGQRPSLIHGLCAFFASNSRFMRLCQAALDTPLDSPLVGHPLSSRFALHGLRAFDHQFFWYI